MTERKITNCSECAYVQQTERGLWCPFHDEPVSSKSVCDDFLGEYETPQWMSLTAGMAGKKLEPKYTRQFTASDIFVYVFTFILLGSGIALLLISL